MFAASINLEKIKDANLMLDAEIEKLMEDYFNKVGCSMHCHSLVVNVAFSLWKFLLLTNFEPKYNLVF